MTTRLKTYQIFNFLLLTLLFFYIVPFFFIFFQGDDYLIFADTHNYDLETYISNFFFSLNSRFGQLFNYRVLAPICDNLLSYRLILLTIFIFFFFTIFKLLKSLKVANSNTKVLFISLICFLTYVNQLPELASGFYWWASVITFQLPLILFMISLICINSFSNDNINIYNKIFLFVLISAFFILIVGSNELLVLQILFFLLLLLIFNDLFYIKKIIIYSLLLIVISLLFISYNKLGTGRIEYHANSKSLYYASTRGLTEFYSYLRTWVSPGFILLSILFTLHVKIDYNFRNSLTLYLFVILIFIFLFFEFVLLFYAVGSQYVPYRAINVFWFFFLFQWLVFITLLRHMIDHLLNINIISSKILNVFLFTLFIYFSISEGNTKSVIKDLLTGKYYNYKLQMDERIKHMESGNSYDDIKVKRLADPPQSIFWSDILEDKYIKPNNDVSKYYKIKSVEIID